MKSNFIQQHRTFWHSGMLLLLLLLLPLLLLLLPGVAAESGVLYALQGEELRLECQSETANAFWRLRSSPSSESHPDPLVIAVADKENHSGIWECFAKVEEEGEEEEEETEEVVKEVEVKIVQHTILTAEVSLQEKKSITFPRGIKYFFSSTWHYWSFLPVPN